MKKLWFVLFLLLMISTVSPAYADETILMEEENEWLEDLVLENDELDTQVGFEEIGPMIYKSSAITSKIASDSNGNTYIYYIMHGTPTALTVVDYYSKEILDTYILEDSKSAWGLEVDQDGVLWVGGTGDTIIYSYNPDTKEFITHLNPFTNKSDTSIQDMVIIDRQIYLTSAYGGSLVSFNTETEEVRDYGQIRKRRNFLKSVAADSNSEDIFLSVGSPIDLLVGDKASGNFKSFLPSKYMGEKYAQDLILTENHVIARLYPTNLAVVFDRQTLKQVGEFEINSRTLSNVSPTGNEVYYTLKGQLMKYSLDSLTATELQVHLPKGTEGVTFDFVKKEIINEEEEEVISELPEEMNLVEDTIESDEEVPMEWIISGMVDNNGQTFDYDITTGVMEYNQFVLPAQPVELYTITSSEDGKTIYTNGYMSGGLGILDVDSLEKELYTEISQIESMVEINKKLYIGAYPLSRLLVYDRSVNWSATNPTRLISLKSYGQERTTAVASINNGKDVVFGTLPDTGVNGGALAFYNVESGKFQIHENYIYNQSIVSLVERDQEIFGGTSIHANQVTNPRGARLFVANKYKPDLIKYIHLPFKSSMITSLIVDRENRIWGMADGTLFSYKDEWKEIQSVELLPLISGKFRNATIIEGEDHYLYGSVEGKFFKVNKDTLEVTWIKNEGVYGLAKDYHGDFYFYNGSKLWKYTIEKNRKAEETKE
ncbi:hypothetical protein [Paenisporosarcina sp. NPDC076898]|uniref:hypothetical protein n=1 Tax=unclassified Paenisporosarcina TaxID=2642018 RepID=UPI003D064E73